MQQLDRGDGLNPRHLCLVPLRFRHEVGGLLIVADKEERSGTVTAFDGDDRNLLDSFAQQAGAALRNAGLHRDLQVAFEALQAAQEKIAQLEQLRALGDLAAEVTHAVRHVMGLVIGHADSHLTLKTDPEKAMKAILAAAEGGQELIDRIDRVTRLGVGRERTLEQLNAVATQALTQARQLEAGATGVDWHSDLAADLPASYLNQADIREVVVNLLVNAAQAIGDEGTVHLRTQHAEGVLRLSVEDTGHGIPDKLRERIFDPFFTTRDGIGGGLGLSIVRRIVEDHGGGVTVDSTQGKGTTFTVSLPVEDTPPAESAAEELFDDDDTEDTGP